MATHQLPLTPEVVHGFFNASTPPALHVASGDTVIFRTLDAGWHTGGLAQPPEQTIPRPEGAGHALSGPIYVEGARPGDVLEVGISELVPAAWGWTYAGTRPGSERYRRPFPGETWVEWDIDVAAGQATARELGITVPLHPFMGVMGNAPAASGPQPTAPPRRVGGNIDCRCLTTGSRLFLPVEVEGALFSTGDGHAAQGDGESSGTGIECPVDLAAMTLTVRRDMALDWPRAETPAGYVTLGFGDTLDAATRIALDGMLDHLEVKLSLPRPHALVVASVAVNLHVTQIVNGVVGVHAVLPPGALRR